MLQQCYGDVSAVDEALVSNILTPGLQPGAVDVFLDFISYSSGPLPEDLLRVRCLGGARGREGARARGRVHSQPAESVGVLLHQSTHQPIHPPPHSPTHPRPLACAQEVRVPVSVVWGEADPWERIEWGRELAKLPSVTEFVSLPGVGHCPQVRTQRLGAACGCGLGGGRF